MKLEPTVFYVIRHGQTGHNQRGIVQGRYEKSELSDLGHQQANSFFQSYKTIPFQKVYTSTLIRTEQTVQQFLNLGLSHESLPGLDEICWGDSEGQHQDAAENKQYWSIIEQWKTGDLNPRLNGGENPMDVQIRQEEALKYIVNQPEKLVLLCMHGRALKIMLAWMSGMSLKEMDRFDHDNLSLYIVEYNDGQWNILKNDERGHLDFTNDK